MTPDVPSKQQIARARLSPERRVEIAKKGAEARWGNKPDRCEVSNIKFKSTVPALKRRTLPTGEHVIAAINKMMKDHSKEEFIAICKMVAKKASVK